MASTNFEKLKNLSMEEMAEFLASQMAIENTIYDKWMVETFCDDCPDIKDYDGSPASFCEINHDCPYGLYCIDDKDLVMRWLSWAEEENQNSK